MCQLFISARPKTNLIIFVSSLVLRVSINFCKTNNSGNNVMYIRMYNLNKKNVYNKKPYWNDRTCCIELVQQLEQHVEEDVLTWSIRHRIYWTDKWGSVLFWRMQNIQGILCNLYIFKGLEDSIWNQGEHLGNWRFKTLLVAEVSAVCCSQWSFYWRPKSSWV